MCIKQPYHAFQCPAPSCTTILFPPTTLVSCERTRVNNVLLATPWFRCRDPLSSPARPIEAPAWLKVQTRSECPGCKEAREKREAVKLQGERQAMEGLKVIYVRRKVKEMRKGKKKGLMGNVRKWFGFGMSTILINQAKIVIF
ncbi:hypothetical protein VTK26DRAFT_6789 [Humicola hyalothermophila]